MDYRFIHTRRTYIKLRKSLDLSVQEFLSEKTMGHRVKSRTTSSSFRLCSLSLQKGRHRITPFLRTRSLVEEYKSKEKGRRVKRTRTQRD